jgi:glycosyltransferase involved in cell wall biosynthesis
VYARHPEIELWLALKDSIPVASNVPQRVFQRPSNAELARCFASCDVYVSSSRREGFGLPPLEAMACGAAVVMTDSGGGLEYARDSENCLLVPPAAPQQLADAVIRVLENPDLESHLRAAGPPTAARFNWDVVLQRCEQALQCCLQAGQPGAPRQ